jgi:hypothetical protein
MVTLGALWLPILLSAILVFAASSVIHMFLGYHSGDFQAPPDEERVAEALRPLPPGDYAIPKAGSMKEMQTPEFKARMERGPVAIMTIRPHGDTGMGRALGLWFVFCLVVSLLAAYVAGRALTPGAPYLEVFRFAGTVAFAGYVLAAWPSTIWYGTDWKTNARNTFDGLVFALLTAGVFGWLWPAG